MKVLLTGASGFLGSNILKRNRNFDIRCVSRSINQEFGDTTRIEKINIKTSWSEALTDIDVVLHCAAIAHREASSVELHEVNFEGTLKLAQDAADSGVKRFIFVSSIGVNGSSTNDRSPFSSKSIAAPHNAYAASKYAAEKALREIESKSLLQVVIIRPTLVYGKGASGNFNSLTQLISRFPILPFDAINNRRSFIAVENLTDLLLTCITHPKASGKTFLASESETVSIKEFTNAIAKGLGKKVYQLPVPASLMRFAGKLLGKSAMVEQLVGNLQVDSSDLRKVLGWTPPYTMEESMALLKEQNKERE